MVNYIELTEHSGYIGQDERFLCPKVGVVHGSKGTFFYDCGTSKRQLDLISELRAAKRFPNPSYLAISHFHADHVANFAYFSSCKTFGSSITARYVRIDEVVAEKVEIDLGEVQVLLMPIISSHCKGSTLMLSSDGVCYLGDALCDNSGAYNRSALYETIKTIESIDAAVFVTGHEEAHGNTKEGVLAFLKEQMKMLAL